MLSAHTVLLSVQNMSFFEGRGGRMLTRTSELDCTAFLTRNKLSAKNAKTTTLDSRGFSSPSKLGQKSASQ
eukprot:NODE_157_length_1289_cov_471.329839_g122_i0.p1 GENE.NODE_157_length_1289_cov_471.329839_g122_i0~~NODE_157_length_1289_cov_471.329839_g122_i0.p1  ORF type:complete len:71 (-),score=0.31 NODE_157_length_1289_cov_471.329839_g122_i0:888-1100(-)